MCAWKVLETASVVEVPFWRVNAVIQSTCIHHIPSRFGVVYNVL